MKTLYTGLLVLALAVPAGVPAQEQPATLNTIARLVEEGENDTALGLLDQRLASNPADPEALFLKGTVLLAQDKPDAAAGAFRELARLYPQLPEAYNNLSAIYASQGDFESARQVLLQARSKAPDYPLLHRNLGDLYVAMALQAYRETLALDPDDSAAAARLDAVERLLQDEP